MSDNLDHIFTTTKKQKLQSIAVAIVGLTLWMTAVITLLELGSNN